MRERYLFAIGDFDGSLFITIIPRSFWEENQCMNDHYTEEQENELRPILDQLEIYFDEEGNHEPIRDYDLNTLREALINAGFEQDEELDNWLIELNNGLIELEGE